MAEAAGLYYEEHGGGGGIPLILSAGLGGSAGYWAPNIARLAHGYPATNRVIAYDHRGTGRSDRALSDVVTVEDMARDMLALMDALDIPKAVIIGHAAGGVAGLMLALIAPDRVERLVVVNGWARADPWFLRCFEARLALLRGSGAEAYVRAQPLFLYPQSWLGGSQDERLAAEEAHALAHFPGAATMEKRIAALAAFDVADRLGEIAAPVLAIAAYDDMLVPWTATAALATGLPNATRAYLRYGAHALNVVDPDRFDELILLWLADEPLTEE